MFSLFKQKIKQFPRLDTKQLSHQTKRLTLWHFHEPIKCDHLTCFSGGKSGSPHYRNFDTEFLLWNPGHKSGLKAVGEEAVHSEMSMASSLNHSSAQKKKKKLVNKTAVREPLERKLLLNLLPKNPKWMMAYVVQTQSEGGPGPLQVQGRRPRTCLQVSR